jgi:hypothetical protein
MVTFFSLDISTSNRDRHNFTGSNYSTECPSLCQPAFNFLAGGIVDHEKSLSGLSIEDFINF